MIEVKNLTKKYGEHLAVDNLSFTVKDGQIYGFLGPNGAGKSTTMNIMTGYLGLTDGQVLINGHDILEEPEEARSCIGYLPEQPPLYMDMTVIGYLRFCAELKKIPRAERTQAVEEAMSKTGIEGVKNRIVRNLSKGYRQRVGLAQAILGMPPIIILDEPTVGLDPKQIIEIRDLIRKLAKDHTVILSSHIMQEISAVCNYIMIISNGRLVASDTPENLMKQQQTASSLELEVRGGRAEVEVLLREIPGIQSVEMQKSREKGAVKAIITEEAGADVREEVFYTLAREHHPLLKMNQERVSLEELFLELTEEAASSQKYDPRSKRRSAKRRFGKAAEEKPEEGVEEAEAAEELVMADVEPMTQAESTGEEVSE
ncbi:MAG: ABC transporter ATP-binding protein [Lachnospiraceae bacterium]|nr:ABC transporter ATP-binding protein [Lachnospiraceae bacterium]